MPEVNVYQRKGKPHICNTCLDQIGRLKQEVNILRRRLTDALMARDLLREIVAVSIEKRKAERSKDSGIGSDTLPGEDTNMASKPVSKKSPIQKSAKPAKPVKR